MCPTCKGARYHKETLEVKYRNKSIADVLEMSIESAIDFFGDQPTISRKISTLHELGLGYLKLGHPSTILSEGELLACGTPEDLAACKLSHTGGFLAEFL